MGFTSIFFISTGKLTKWSLTLNWFKCSQDLFIKSYLIAQPEVEYHQRTYFQVENLNFGKVYLFGVSVPLTVS